VDLLSAEHVAVLGVTAGAAAAAIRWPAPRALALLIGAAYLVEHAYFIARGTWSLDFNLPLHLTDVVTVVAVLALWTRRPLLVELTWFWALTASLQAVLTPDLGSADFPDLVYWTFFITHSGAVVAAVLLVAGLGIRPRPGAVARVFAATLAVAAAAGAANLLTGGNYMWLREKPDEASLLDVMGPWPWYILSAAVLALILFTLLAAPFRRHRPMMSPERAEALRAWHDADYRPGRDPGRVERHEYLGLVLDIPETVQPIFPASHLLGESVLAEVREADRVLDMGTGSGVNAILAARTAREVVAVDVNPDALRAARRNAELNGVADRVHVLESDVFDNVEGVFDLIVFDPPFRWFAPRDMAERATADEDYRALTRFFDEVGGRLADGGRILVFFGTSGDVDYLWHLIDAAGLTREELRSLSGEKDGEPVTYWTFRLARG
jgi:release factor glutamine methyltransferase